MSRGVCWGSISEVVAKVGVRVRDGMSPVPLSPARRVAMACTGGGAEAAGTRSGERWGKACHTLQFAVLEISELNYSSHQVKSLSSAT